MAVCGTGYRSMVLELCRTKRVFVNSLDIAPLWFCLLLKLHVHLILVILARKPVVVHTAQTKAAVNVSSKKVGFLFVGDSGKKLVFNNIYEIRRLCETSRLGIGVLYLLISGKNFSSNFYIVPLFLTAHCFTKSLHNFFFFFFFFFSHTGNDFTPLGLSKQMLHFSSTIHVLYLLLPEETSTAAVWSRMALSKLLVAWSTGATSVTRRGEELDICSAPWADRELMLLEVVRCAGGPSAAGEVDWWSKV